MIPRLVNSLLGRFGLRLITANSPFYSAIPENVEKDFLPIYERCRHHTLSSFESLFAIYKSVEHITRHQIEGDLVECGVWAGGGVMAAALSLQHFGDVSRKIWLYDTFEGMAAPTDKDVDFKNRSAADHLKTWKATDFSEMARVGIEDVKARVLSSGYPAERFVFVKGLVEDTLPSQSPARVSFMRLDTDWYASTKHELDHLFPKLIRNGVMIVDDYGFWKGSREACDAYFAEHKIPILLTRLDRQGPVIGVKP